MHRHVFYKQFMGETQEQVQQRECQLANLLHAVETFPEEAAEFLYRTYVQDQDQQNTDRMILKESPSSSLDHWKPDDDIDVISCSSEEEINSDVESFNSLVNRKRKRENLKLNVSPGKGFELLDGPNVVMFYSKEPHQRVSQCPIVIRPSKCQRRLDMTPIEVDGHKVLQRCNSHPWSKRENTWKTRIFRDLITQIASHLSIQDTARCMLVCKAWKTRLSAHSANMWKRKEEKLSNIMGGYNIRPFKGQMRRTCFYYTFGMDMNLKDPVKVKRAGAWVDYHIQNHKSKRWLVLLNTVVSHYIGESVVVSSHKCDLGSNHKSISTRVGRPVYFDKHGPRYKSYVFTVVENDPSKIRIFIRYGKNFNTGKYIIEDKIICFGEFIRPYMEYLKNHGLVTTLEWEVKDGC